MVVLDAAGPRHPRRPALERHPLGAGRAATSIAEFGADELRRSAPASSPSPRFTATKLRWLRDAEPENAARVAAVALPHDWLTWRLRGYGPAARARSARCSRADHRPLGRQRHRLLVDPAHRPAYDRDLLDRRRSGHDARACRACSAAHERRAAGPSSCRASRRAAGRRRARATTPAPRSASAPQPATSSSRSAPAARSSPSPDAPIADADRHGRRLRGRRAATSCPLIATLNAARVLDSIAGAARPSTTTSSAALALDGRARRRRRRARAVLRGRAHAQPARRDRDPVSA